MGKEIERKYLIKDDTWRKDASGTTYRQGYLSTVKERTVRVRTIDDKGFLTIKGITIGATRREYEYEIPMADANEMLDELCEKPIIEKTRFKISHAGLTWEIDEFAGVNQGLIVAEVELESEDQNIDFPPWVGEEVSGDPRYFNSNLIANPFANW
ncbi:MAG: CYTH domain-containing protein [Nitrospinaceae bacterium]|jgi:adenylate cyclase|nr:CYTH domain-containing protein [Nitrospinaceae bacterium]|tara:strand:- start:452 stop:916 length:465 start_codon:yes stop_codon:yes gene_type:complete